MKQRDEKYTVQKTGGIEQACFRYGLGRNKMRSVAKEAEAEIKMGKRYLINFSKVDDHMDSLSGVCEEGNTIE